MVSIVTKKIHGKEYLYLVESKREKGKVIQKTIKYIGKKRPIPKDEFACMQYSCSEKDWILDSYSDELSYQDHAEMKNLSDSFRKYLDTLDRMSRQKEKEKFLSRFIANSNAIEGSTLTVKDTFNYLFNDISPKGHAKKELYMAENMLKAWNYLEEHHSSLPSHDDLFAMHKMVNRGIESDETLGAYKKVQNYVGETYTSSYLFTEERMDKLFSWVKKAFAKMDNFEVAFQSHAQFEIIHPFVDGNGRVGRLLLNWLLMHRKLMPLAIRNSKRSDYISALSNASRGKVEAISRFCFREYKNQYALAA